MQNTSWDGISYTNVGVTLDECKAKCTAAKWCTAVNYQPTTMICQTYEALIYDVYEQGPGNYLYIRNCA
ncbi:hypothetical protein DPMN_185309 [Dreissena polymorpha]|uniref:Apple domain-containing protein n=1 Tax=Dreissena polymorpha TaxID=45954 RepID=A0A9D4DKQ6_DREPO|nr:hypothetical protein DPMN_185309 [Dreissena polymorpha]